MLLPTDLLRMNPCYPTPEEIVSKILESIEVR